ncbi:MAG: AAA family ATPase [Desulfuromonadales bacterium]
MANKIFVAATGQNCGKTTTSLSLFHLARTRYDRVGFIKPIGPKPSVLDGLTMDKDAALMARVYGLEADKEFMSPVVLHHGSTKKILDGEIPRQELEDRILRAVDYLENKCDFLIIEGAGHSGVGSVIGMSNARIARMLDAPVMMVTGGGVGNVIDAVSLNLALYEQEGAEVRMLLANKLIPEKREETLHYMGLAFAHKSFLVNAGFNYHPILANPTLRRIAEILDLDIMGEQGAAGRIVHHVQLGAAATQRVADLLRESTLLLVTSSRDELLVTLANLYQMEQYRDKIAGLVIPGVAPISRITQQILDRSNIPYMRTHRTTAELFLTIKEDVSKITVEDREKIELILELGQKRLPFGVIDELFAR